MATFQEVLQQMVDKTSVQVTGIVKSVNEYISKKTKLSYWSVDVEVKGHKTALNLRLPENPGELLKLYDVKTFHIIISPGFEGKGVDLNVINIGQ